MTEAAAETADLERPDNCLADLTGDYPWCAKCGLAWWKRSGTPAPLCQAMTLTRMQELLFDEISHAEASHIAVLDYQARGAAADPLPSRVRMAELKSILRLVDRIKGNDAILDILNPNRRRS